MQLKTSYSTPVVLFQCPIVLSIIACVVAIFIVLAPVIAAPAIEFLYAFLFIVAGVIFYFPFVHLGYEIPGMGEWAFLVHSVVNSCVATMCYVISMWRL